MGVVTFLLLLLLFFFFFLYHHHQYYNDDGMFLTYHVPISLPSVLFPHLLLLLYSLTASFNHPYRPGAPRCSYYDETGTCAFRSLCGFDHRWVAILVLVVVVAAAGGGEGEEGGQERECGG